MTAQLLDGKTIAAEVRAEVGEGVVRFRAEQGRAPGLHLIVVSDDAGSHTHVRNKQRAAALVGMEGHVHTLPADVALPQLLATIDRLNQDDAVDAILVQLPLPTGLDEAMVLGRIAPAKDVDGLHPENAGALLLGYPRLVAPTARGCMHLLRATGLALAGRRALVIGRSNIVGRPVAQLLLAAHATVTVAHSRSTDLDALCREADILVVAAGRAHLVRGDWVKPGAVVIDVGLSRDADGKLRGDVAFDEAVLVASWISPVPGGVGPLTIACLLENTLRAAEHRVGEGAARARQSADGSAGNP